MMLSTAQLRSYVLIILYPLSIVKLFPDAFHPSQAVPAWRAYPTAGAELFNPFGLSLSKPFRIPFDELKVTGATGLSTSSR